MTVFSNCTRVSVNICIYDDFCLRNNSSLPAEVEEAAGMKGEKENADKENNEEKNKEKHNERKQESRDDVLMDSMGPVRVLSFSLLTTCLLCIYVLLAFNTCICIS